MGDLENWSCYHMCYPQLKVVMINAFKAIIKTHGQNANMPTTKYSSEHFGEKDLIKWLTGDHMC